MLTALRIILRTAAKSLGVERAAATAAIHEVWPEVVGAEVAAHTKPAGLQGDVLCVDAAPGPWAQELSAQRTQVVAVLNERLGFSGIRDLRVRQRVGAFSPPRPASQPPSVVDNPTLTPDEVALIEQAVAEIGDAEVREAAKRAMISQWRWRKRQLVDPKASR